MKSLNAKLVLAALGFAVIATPALAQEQHWQPAGQGLYDYADPPAADPVGIYPNPIARSGSAAAVDSGGQFNLDRGY
jgi:hypothetical protein